MLIISSHDCFFNLLFSFKFIFIKTNHRELHDSFSNGEPSSSRCVQMQFLIKIFGRIR